MFRCRGRFSSGPIMSVPGVWELVARDGALWLHGAGFDYDIEDAFLCGEHDVTLVPGPPARVFLDGYEAWSADVYLRGTPVAGQCELTDEPEPSARLAEHIRDTTPPPRPLYSFAAMSLSDDDARAAGRLSEMVVRARFRVRGPGQYGTIFAASMDGQEVIRATIDSGIQVRAGSVSAHARGEWSDGRWHDLALSFAAGAVQIWVDGWLYAHEPGSPPRFDRLVIGQDLRGQRLMGEVGRGGIYPRLSDQQIALVARRPVLTQVPVFDSFPTGAFHRIPALTRAGGTLLAFADRRRDLPNDAPNATDLVLRRSHDDGLAWGEVQTIASFPGTGTHGVAVTDAAAVEDGRGRIHVLADFYPAGTGLLNCAPGPGMEEAGLILRDSAGGVVHMPAWPSQPTRLEGGWVVAPDGSLTHDGADAGNILIDGDLQLLKTGHIALWTSEDEGATWSAMRLITDQVKDAWMTFLGIGPGAGIRLRHGPHTGRLLIPAYFSTLDGHHHSACMLISDDDGATWRRGESVRAAGPVCDERTFTDPARTMTESAVVETAAGVEMFARSQHTHVLRSLSTDGGQTWSPGVADSELPEIFCQPAATLADGEVYFANATRMLPYRGCGTVYRAGSEGWIGRAINPRHHGYQALAPIADGIGMLWERESAGIWFTALPTSLFVY